MTAGSSAVGRESPTRRTVEVSDLFQDGEEVACSGDVVMGWPHGSGHAGPLDINML